MSERSARLPVVTADDMRQDFAAVLDRAAAGKERVIVTRRGKPSVAIVSMEDVELLEEIEDRLDAKDFRAAFREWKMSGRKSKPLDQVIRELGLKR